MLQPDALTELLKGCQAAGVHTAVDTAGNVPWESFEHHKLGNSKYRALEAQNVFEGTVPLKDEVEMLKKKYGFQ